MFRLFHEKGLLDGDEKLCLHLQHYLEDRFDFMDKDKVIFEYLEFLKDLGLWYWNTTLIGQMEDHFRQNFFLFDLDQLSRLTRLIAYNFDKSEEFITLIEDSIKVRLSHAIKAGEPIEISLEGMLALTEGISMLSIRRPRLLALLKRILIEMDTGNAHSHPLAQSGQLLVQTLNLFSDFDVSAGSKLSTLLDSALSDVHLPMDAFGVKDLSYLALCGN